MIIDIQLNQGSAPWPHLRDAALVAEETGFGSLWNLDHFSGAMFDADSMLECFTCLGAWAACTSHIGLGTLVANVNNRVPGLLANAVSSIQEISGNRLTLGIGSGASPSGPYGAEHATVGIHLLATMAQRHARLVEVLNELRGIWAMDRDEEFLGFPQPTLQPPVIVGINSLALARIAGERADGVNTRFNHPDRSELLRTAREASGHRSDFDTSVWSWFEPEYADPAHPFHQELVADGVTRLIMLEKVAPRLDVIASTAKYLS